MDDEYGYEDYLQDRHPLEDWVEEVLCLQDSAIQFVRELPRRFPFAEVRKGESALRPWELAGTSLLLNGQTHEALAVFSSLYEHMLKAQEGSGRIHKGMPLVWIADCYYKLGCPVHAKRYLMLTLCEDAVNGQGVISPDTSGVFFRLVWRHGLSINELERYARRLFQLACDNPEMAVFPEYLLQHLDDYRWLTDIPLGSESYLYRINQLYAQKLHALIGKSSGTGLEQLAEYLMSCIPGCRTKRRQRTKSTDFDLVCAVEGFEQDFRSELGRYFICECKDWDSPADFTTMAKLCRVLDSIKARFGILFSKSGISGAGKTKHAEREQLKVFQDRGIVIVVLDQTDLSDVTSGADLISLLREHYENIRLDLEVQGNQPLS